MSAVIRKSDFYPQGLVNGWTVFSRLVVICKQRSTVNSVPTALWAQTTNAGKNPKELVPRDRNVVIGDAYNGISNPVDSNHSAFE